MKERILVAGKEAYFTVEAAFIVPLVLGVIVFILYLFFYQYDRCLTEQDMGRLTLLGSHVFEEQKKEELMQRLQNADNAIYQGKYVAWSGERTNIKLEQNLALVEKTSSIQFPFTSPMFSKLNDVWKIDVNYTNHRIDPVSFVRRYHKLIGGD